MKNIKDKLQIVKAAPLAVSGAVGAEFWEEVAKLLGAKKDLVTPRRARNS